MHFGAPQLLTGLQEALVSKYTILYNFMCNRLGHLLIPPLYLANRVESIFLGFCFVSITFPVSPVRMFYVWFYFESENFNNFFKVQKKLYDLILWIKVVHPVLDCHFFILI